MPSIKKDHELIQRGPYRVVRHPIYTGLLLAVFGSCLAEGRVWNLCVFGMVAILLIVKLRRKKRSSRANSLKSISNIGGA